MTLFDHMEGLMEDFAMTVNLHAKAMGLKATGGDILTIAQSRISFLSIDSSQEKTL